MVDDLGYGDQLGDDPDASEDDENEQQAEEDAEDTSDDGQQDEDAAEGVLSAGPRAAPYIVPVWEDARDGDCTTCTECGAGRYQPIYGAGNYTLCVPCARGNYSSRAGASACERCPRGTWDGARHLGCLRK